MTFNQKKIVAFVVAGALGIGIAVISFGLYQKFSNKDKTETETKKPTAYIEYDINNRVI